MRGWNRFSNRTSGPGWSRAMVLVVAGAAAAEPVPTGYGVVDLSVSDRSAGACLATCPAGRTWVVTGDVLTRRATPGSVEVVPGHHLVRYGSIEQAMAALGPGDVLDVMPPRVLRSPGDPSFDLQWTLQNALNPVADVNVVPAWDLGYTGHDVVVGILELAYQVDHPDLAANFVAEASQDSSFTSAHATSVAGIVGMACNGIGGVGVAYDVGLSRLVFGTTSQTAAAFLHRNDLNDIKNNSWGPNDNGRLWPISDIEYDALELGAMTGRGGLGEIYVWAAGNGGLNDRSDYDGYVTTRYVIPVGGIGDFDVRSSFTEPGSANFVVAHTAGNIREVYTTTTTSAWTDGFGGTSAAAPLASGVVALMLDANPNLTWRDVQHILVESARKCDPNNAGWETNGAGRDIHYNYGYGAVDAHAAVLLAEAWTSVANETFLDTEAVMVDQAIPDDGTLEFEVATEAPITIETVEVLFDVSHSYRGELEVVLTSPMGTESILHTQQGDPSNDLDHRFLTRRLWGERAQGTWTVRITDLLPGNAGHLNSVRLVVHGTPQFDCPWDLNEDGALDVDDVLVMVALIQASDPQADFNGDGMVNIFDVFTYLKRFEAGCE
ncbi:MAG: S8 family serine peptidase [Phycisphaerales bacterium]|nr:S8 family serine peptidase [Phycisphaerales bacterium]